MPGSYAPEFKITAYASKCELKPYSCLYAQLLDAYKTRCSCGLGKFDRAFGFRATLMNGSTVGSKLEVRWRRGELKTVVSFMAHSAQPRNNIFPVANLRLTYVRMCIFRYASTKT